MTALPPTLAAENAISKQNIALSVIKASADADQAIANILDQSLRSAPVSASRGVNLNTSA
ncbi:MAG: hypothetical protein GW778_01640 [Alphaproteobacteria bacterium]|nr:hypothetical protein [Alphaproteobacteria bacterium]